MACGGEKMGRIEECYECGLALKVGGRYQEAEAQFKAIL